MNDNTQELIAELVKVAKMAEHFAGRGFVGDITREEAERRLIAAARAAIAKAKGIQ